MRGAVFFDEKKKGLDQILYSLGVDDVEVGKRTIIAAMRQTNDQNIGRISYKNFNSIQKVRELQSLWSIIFRGFHPPSSSTFYYKLGHTCLSRPQVDESSESESRYDRLLARVGAAISIHPELVKLVSYIVLFSADFTGVKNRYRVETIQVREKLS